MHKQTIHILFPTFEFIQRTEIDIVTQISSRIRANFHLMVVRKRLYKFLQVQVSVDWLIKFKSVADLLFLALIAAVVGNSEVLVVVGAVL